MEKKKSKNDAIFKLQVDFFGESLNFTIYQSFRKGEGVFQPTIFQTVNSETKFGDHNVSKKISFIMTDLDQGSSHFQVIDANPTK